MDLWRHCSKNAAAVSTAVDDVELVAQEGLRTLSTGFTFQLGTSGAFLDSLRSCPVHSGRAQHGHRSARDRLQFSISRSLLVTNIWVDCLNTWDQRENWERCYEKQDIMMSLEIYGVTIPILSAAHAAQWIYIRFTNSREEYPNRAAVGVLTRQGGKRAQA